MTTPTQQQQDNKPPAMSLKMPFQSTSTKLFLSSPSEQKDQELAGSATGFSLFPTSDASTALPATSIITSTQQLEQKAPGQSVLYFTYMCASFYGMINRTLFSLDKVCFQRDSHHPDILGGGGGEGVGGKTESLILWLAFSVQYILFSSNMRLDF